MKVLKRNPDGVFDWIEVAKEGPLKIALEDGQVLEIDETEDRKGLNFLSVRTADGILVIYPEAANMVHFRVTEA